MDATLWTLDEGLRLCRIVEELSPKFGCHVAMTGGVLYKDGPRKDLDLLFYRIRQVREIDKDGLLKALHDVGFRDFAAKGWVTKSKWGFKVVDLFFPDYDGPEHKPAVGGSYG